MSPRTKHNLTTAMKCDAIDAATYNRFAAHARKEEEWELAKAFQETADRDRFNHFEREAEFEGLIRGSNANLRNAIDTENKEAKMFAHYAQEANEDGDSEAAALFEKISRDKMDRQLRFERILGDMGLHSDVETIGA